MTEMSHRKKNRWR